MVLLDLQQKYIIEMFQFLQIEIKQCKEVSLSRILLSKLKSIKKVIILACEQLTLEYEAFTFTRNATVILGNIGKIILG